MAQIWVVSPPTHLPRYVLLDSLRVYTPAHEGEAHHLGKVAHKDIS